MDFLCWIECYVIIFRVVCASEFLFSPVRYMCFATSLVFSVSPILINISLIPQFHFLLKVSVPIDYTLQTTDYRLRTMTRFIGLSDTAHDCI
jgi:hypothetical protein